MELHWMGALVTAMQGAPPPPSSSCRGIAHQLPSDDDDPSDNENSVDPLNQSDDVLQAAVENEEKGHVERRQGDEQRRCLVPRRRAAEAQGDQERSSGETA